MSKTHQREKTMQNKHTHILALSHNTQPERKTPTFPISEYALCHV